jgi:hypothetical protein
MTRKGDFLRTPASGEIRLQKFGLVIFSETGEAVLPQSSVGFGAVFNLSAMNKVPNLGVQIFAQAHVRDLSGVDDFSLTVDVDGQTLHEDRTPVATKDSRVRKSPNEVFDEATIHVVAAQDNMTAASHTFGATIINGDADTPFDLMQLVLIVDAVSVTQFDIIAPV